MRRVQPLLATDFYKVVHHKAYKEGMQKLVSYFTPRMSRIENCEEVVVFGIQAFIKEQLIERFNEDFFQRDWKDLKDEYVRMIKHTFGEEHTNVDHIEALHKLGYLPIKLCVLEEGMKAPIKTPILSITNTHDEFAWLVNYLETFMSVYIWQGITSATIGHLYRKIIKEYYEKTGCTRPVETACGDFSMRGMSSEESAMKSAAGHLLSFTSTATIPAIYWLEKFYNADIEKEGVGFGTASMEHSVMCTYGKEELECFRHMITEVFPKGNLSIVSDTYDYFGIFEHVLPRLKQDILARDGKIIIRGDSGDPVDIICGTKTEQCVTPEEKGTVELLYEIFGGNINEKGYKELDPHVAAIYGDSITRERALDICQRLEKKGFAISNVTFGIGSYTYQYNTRDTFGFALKATYAVIDGKEVQIFKEPKTDKDHFKKSQRGLCFVYEEDGKIQYQDGLLQADYDAMASQKENLLQVVFEDGKLLKDYTLKEVRDRLNS